MASGLTAPTLLVLSDTHGVLQNLAAVLNWAKNRKDITHLAFLGDGAADLPIVAERVGYRPAWTLVRGNGDFEHHLPLQQTVQFADKRLFLTHGHIQGVHDSLDTLLRVAAMEEVDAILFGHIHRPYWEELDHRLVLNPGSLGKPRNPQGPTFATITCPPGKWFEIRFWTVSPGVLGNLTVRELEL
ncbi:metallophosphoesterase family protein [Gracilinema caldarium]|uniref:Phosphoesterase n=1 Tax=Gracilinema caldarium (strain ATCC 51460 / DSM 7334 / H1) TaxID=744872 RepID=F8F007_GRAC1|nr:YfcE family phosphodiesterase [Gracilinema caldarium]AEJ18660.1 phosphodiesterase, MJ0936 family [Gracilinema caldarium DSM 7334]